MTKINVLPILIDHCKTLRDVRTGSISWTDLIVFYVLPFAAAFTVWVFEFEVTAEAYNVSITFFGIFIALLLNIQVAIFSIFQRKWNAPIDMRAAAVQEKTLNSRRELLTELNVNISYLILICCFAVLAALVLLVQKWLTGVAPALMLFFYIHFILTLVMVVRRAHALFHKEYRDSPG